MMRETEGADMLKLIPILGFAAVLSLAGCTNDDEGDETPPEQQEASDIASASASTEQNTLDLACPDPIGTVQVTRDEGDDWSPSYVVGSGAILDPVAYGEIVFTDATTGQTTTKSPVVKEGANTANAVECSFVDEVDEQNAAGQEVQGTVKGTVSVVQRAG